MSTTTSTHKQSAAAFLDLAAQGRAREAMDRFASPQFFHHNPYFPSDGASLARGMDENAKEFPNKQLDIVHSIEEGDLVMTFSRVLHAPDRPEAAVMHIFRFEGDRIAELWDAGQEIPKDSPNERGAF